MESHPDAAIFPLMEGSEFQELVEDIRKNGLLDPVVMLDGKVLDGRNRVRACQEAGVSIRHKEAQLNGLTPMEYVVSENVRRRHLTASQRAAMAVTVMPRLQAEARERQRTGAPGVYGGKPLSANLREPVEKGKAAEQAAEMFTVSPRQVEAAKHVKSKSKKKFNEIVSGKTTVSRAKKDVNRAARKRLVESAASKVADAGDRYELHADPCITALKLPANSFDLIVTDPPYERGTLGVYDDLGAVAAHVLKPGGFALVMTGQTHLPAVMKSLAAHLTYHWVLAYLTPGGQAVQQFQRKAEVFWKPVLMYVKGEYEGGWFSDVCRSEPNDNDKRFHEWGQSLSGMRDLMKRFVKPGQSVLDLFVGAGTTAVSALELGAKFTGYDSDPQAIKLTKGRISELSRR